MADIITINFHGVPAGYIGYDVELVPHPGTEIPIFYNPDQPPPQLILDYLTVKAWYDQYGGVGGQVNLRLRASGGNVNPPINTVSPPFPVQPAAVWDWYVTGAPPPRPAPPVALTPGAATSPGPPVSSLTPVLQWSAVAGADYYGLLVRKSPYGDADIVYDAQQVAGTSLPVPAGKLVPGWPYRWGVVAHNSAGWGEWSNILYFQTPGQPPPPPGPTGGGLGTVLAVSAALTAGLLYATGAWKKILRRR